MIRLLNFSCFAITALSCLALYHVSEQTRVARIELGSVKQQIVDQKEAMKVLEADWARVSEPSRIQHLAALKLGVEDTPTVALASFDSLPHRNDANVEQANLEAPARPADPRLHLAALHSGE